MEDGIFPSYMTVSSEDPSDLEEERRLCYVGITRAMKQLTLTCARQRMARGEIQYNRMSRFIKEIPDEYLSIGQPAKPKTEVNQPTKRKYGLSRCKKCFQEQGTGSETVQGRKGRKPGLYGRGQRKTHQIRCGDRGSDSQTAAETLK